MLIICISGGFRNLLRGVRDSARRRRARFFLTPLRCPQGGAKIAQGGAKKKRARQTSSGGRQSSEWGGDGQTLINRHNTVIKPFKFSRKGFGVLDNFLLNT